MTAFLKKLGDLYAHLDRLLLGVFALLFVYIFLAGMQWIQNQGLPFWGLWLPFPAAAILSYAGWRTEPDLRTARRFLLIAALVFIATRLAWILLVPTQPSSDFKVYDDFARLIAAGEPVGPLLAAQWPLRQYSLGYPVVLAAVYAVFGGSWLAARLLNVVFGLLSLLLLYQAARQASGGKAARLAALFFILWPAQLVFTSVLASDHLALLLALAGMVALQRALQAEKPAFIGLAAAGFLFALGYAVRTTNLLLFLAGLLVIFLEPSRLPGRQIYTRTISAALLVISFSAALFAYRGVMLQTTGAYPAPSSSFSLMIGANIQSGGMWNRKDYRLTASIPTFEQASAFAWQEARRRIAADPLGFGTLTLRKLASLWQDDSYAIYWSTLSLDTSRFAWQPAAFTRVWMLISQIFYLAAWLLAACAAVFLFRRPNPQLRLLLLTLLGGSLLHAVLEVQNRYHYWLVPMILILAAAGVASIAQGKAAPQASLPAARPESQPLI